MKNFGIRGEELVVSIGANAKMNEFSAIMGLCNLKHIDETIKAREKRCSYYNEKISELKDIHLFNKIDNVVTNYAYYPIIVDNKTDGISRDGLYKYLRSKEIYSRKYFYPITADQACFKNKYRNNQLDNARELSDKILVLPFYEDIQKSEMDRVIDGIYEYVNIGRD